MNDSSGKYRLGLRGRGDALQPQIDCRLSAVMGLMIERDRENLIRPAGRVVASFTVDDVVEISAVGEPEALVERTADARRLRRQVQRGRPALAARPPVEQPERFMEVMGGWLEKHTPS